MVNRIIRTKVPVQTENDPETPISPVSVRSAVSLEDRSGLMDFTKQFGRSASSRGPLFWACLCFFLLILILGLIALIIFLVYYVGLPQLQILGVQLPTPDPNNAAQIQQDSQINIDLGQNGGSPGISFKVNVNIKIANPNKLDLSFDKIDIYAYHPLAQDVSIGRAFLQDVVLPKQDDLFMVVPLQVDYSFKNDPLGVVPKDLVDSCTVAPGESKPSKQLKLDLKLNARMKITSLIKIDLPTITASPSFDCPQTVGSNITILGKTYNLRDLDFKAISQGVVGTRSPSNLNMRS